MFAQIYRALYGAAIFATQKLRNSKGPITERKSYETSSFKRVLHTSEGYVLFLFRNMTTAHEKRQ